MISLFVYEKFVLAYENKMDLIKTVFYLPEVPRW